MIEKKRRTLLVVAHGSRSRSWTSAVTRLVEHMSSLRPTDSPFSDVQPAFLENASPNIDEAIDAAHRAGATELVALPLFLTRSGHLEDDVPAALGGRAELLAPLEPARWLVDNLFRRLQRQDVVSFDTIGAVLVAYGSSTHGHLWDAMLDDVCRGLRDRGIADTAFSYVGHVAGLSPEPTVNALKRLASSSGVKQLYVLPVLFGVGMLQEGPIQTAVRMGRTQLEQPVAYAADAILPDEELAQALFDHATILTVGGSRPQSNHYAT